MPSGQYFYTNPQAAAIANNLSKIFFGDPEAKLREQQIQNLALENQIRQQTIDENNTVNEARGSISRLFSTMDPNDVAKNAPAFYSEFARLAGRDGFGANDGSTLIRGFAANAGGNDQTIARAFLGAGNGLNTNEGVSIADRNELQKRALAPQYYNVDQREAGADRRFTVEVNTPGETVYVPNAPGGQDVYTAAPEAVANAFKVAGASGSKSKFDFSPAEAAKMDELIGKSATGIGNIDNEGRTRILTRAGEIYRETGDAARSVEQAISELTESRTTPQWWGLTSKTSRTMKKDEPLGAAFAPTGSDAETAAANGIAAPSSAAPAPGNKVVAPPEMKSMGPADAPEGTVQRNKRTGVVRKVVNGQWVIINAPAQ